MVQQAGDVALHAAIEVLALIQIEDVNRSFSGDFGSGQTLVGAALAFAFADLFSGVFQDLCAGGNVSPGEDALGVNGGTTDNMPDDRGCRSRLGFGHEEGKGA